MVRDWSLITEGGGGLQNGKIAGPKVLTPLSRQGKTCHAPPLFKNGNFLYSTSRIDSTGAGVVSGLPS